MCDNKQEIIGTVTYELEKGTNVVNAFTAITEKYFAIQILNVEWIADLVSGKIVLMLYIQGEDTTGPWQYNIVVLGKNFPHPALQMSPLGLWVASNKNNGGVFVMQMQTYEEDKLIFPPITYPTKHEDHVEFGLTNTIQEPSILTRLNDTPGRIIHLWEKVEVLNLDIRVMMVIVANMNEFK